MCCREHDHCDHIPANSEKYGLYNNQAYSVMSCDCERKFEKCLKNVGSTEAYGLGAKYFNINDVCFKRNGRDGEWVENTKNPFINIDISSIINLPI